MTFDAAEEMNKSLHRKFDLSKGDRVLLALFLPLSLAFSAYAIVMLHRIVVRSITGSLLKWAAVEFFILCFSCAGLFFVWVVAKPRWIEDILDTTMNRLIIWLSVLFVIGLACGAIAQFYFWMTDAR